MKKGSKRSPRRLVRRFFAERYLLVTLLTFAASVSLTRLFLEISGYPQLGNSVLHIAHLLWGGFFLFAASLLPLIYANQRALDIGAALAGIGMGLFIDEVGKFITRNNDYFFPAAAPIVYVAFLLTLFIYQIIKPRTLPDKRTRLYHVLEQLEEVLEGDLSERDRNRILANLSNYISDSDSVHLDRLERLLIEFLNDEEQSLVIHQADIFEKFSDWWLKTERKLFKSQAIPKWLIFCWGVWGLISIARPVLSVYADVIGFSLPGAWQQLITTSIDSTSGFSFLEWARILTEIFIGIGLLLSVVLALLKVRFAATVAYIGLLAMIGFVNIIVFYYEQFSAIFFTLFQFLVLFATVRYRWIYRKN